MVAEADVRLLNKQYLPLSYQFHFPIHHLTLTDLNTHPWLNEYTTRAISIYIKHLGTFVHSIVSLSMSLSRQLVKFMMDAYADPYLLAQIEIVHFS